MGMCYKLFKIGIIILTLVQVAIGYMKVYQLFADIGSTLTQGGSVESFSDLAWLPYLFIQVFTTVFIVLQVYFLFRELCYDNFMYDCCFRCCFVLTVLNFLLVIFPKTIINIIYHTNDITIEEWWTQIVDTLDSLIANFSNLGFQIILYMKLLKKVFQCLRCCQQRVTPLMKKAVNKTQTLRGKGKISDIENTAEMQESNVNADIERTIENDDTMTQPGCCLFIPMVNKGKPETDTSPRHTQEAKDGNYSKVINSESINKLSAQKDAMEAKLDQAITNKVENINKRVGKYSNKMKNAMIDKHKVLKRNVANKLHIPVTDDGVCVCSNPVISTVMSITDITDNPESTWTGEGLQKEHHADDDGTIGKSVEPKISNTPEDKRCETCGKVVREPRDSSSRFTKCYNSKRMLKCRTLCGLLENRPLCMKITLIMSGVHFLAYIVELVFIFI